MLKYPVTRTDCFRIVFAKILRKDIRLESGGFRKLQEIEQKLHALLKGKTSPKDRMMPIRAAIDAGVIRRPTYTELQSTFGKDFVANSSYHNYTNPDKHPYDANPSFTLLVSEFKKIVE